MAGAHRRTFSHSSVNLTFLADSWKSMKHSTVPAVV